MRFCECGQPVFSTDKKTGIGYCKFHSYKRTDTDKRSIIQKAISKNKVKQEETKVRSLINRDAEEAKKVYEIEKFFSDAAKELEKHPYCSECNKYIPRKYYRAATAHIFPKEHFQSIAAHPMNKLFLGAGCGCHNKTHTIETFSKMKVFPLAIERFYLFEKEIKENHKYLSIFKEVIKKYKDGIRH